VILESDVLGLIIRLQYVFKGDVYIDVISDNIKSLVPCFYLLMSSHVKRVEKLLLT